MTTSAEGDRVRRLLDRDSIEELARTYMRGLDRRDTTLLRSVFHDDATTHYGSFSGGPDDFVTMAMRALGTHEINQHLIGQVNLWFGDDTHDGTDDADDGRTGHATGEVYFHAFHRLTLEGVRTDMVISGRYIDRYERRGGRWGMTHRTEIVDWARTEPTLDGYMPHRPHLVVGRPGPDDLSYHIDRA